VIYGVAILAHEGHFMAQLLAAAIEKMSKFAATSTDGLVNYHRFLSLENGV
jgi:hypothetical protein